MTRKVNYSTYLKKTKQLEKKVSNLQFFIKNKLYDYVEIKLKNIKYIKNNGNLPIYVGVSNLTYDFHVKGFVILPFGQIEFPDKVFNISIYVNKENPTAVYR